MKRHTLILLSVLLYSGSCSGGDEKCNPLFVQVGETATIKCNILNRDQDGVYLYKHQGAKTKKESVLYYYKDGELTTEDLYTGRVETNKNISDFSVFLRNVSETDVGIYWCQFNKLDVETVSETTCLLVQSVIIITVTSIFCMPSIFLGIIGGLAIIILVLVILLVKLCCDRGNYTPKHQSSNGVYEVMHGRGNKALVNPAYESRETHNRRNTHTSN